MAKKTVLLIGGGGVGTIAALNLDIGGLAEVTIVLRSNFNAVNEKGFQIESCDHGVIKNWKPSHGQSFSLITYPLCSSMCATANTSST